MLISDERCHSHFHSIIITIVEFFEGMKNAIIWREKKEIHKIH